MALNSDERTQAIFGGFDGTTSVIVMVGAALVANLVHGVSTATLGVSALGVSVGAAWSMGSGQYLSDDQRRVHLALVMTLATLVGSIVPALPFVVGLNLGLAAVLATILTVIMGAVIAELRPEARWPSYRLTFTVLLIGVVLGVPVGLVG